MSKKEYTEPGEADWGPVKENLNSISQSMEYYYLINKADIAISELNFVHSSCENVLLSFEKLKTKHDIPVLSDIEIAIEGIKEILLPKNFSLNLGVSPMSEWTDDQEVIRVAKNKFQHAYEQYGKYLNHLAISLMVTIKEMHTKHPQKYKSHINEFWEKCSSLSSLIDILSQKLSDTHESNSKYADEILFGIKNVINEIYLLRQDMQETEYLNEIMTKYVKRVEHSKIYSVLASIRIELAKIKDKNPELIIDTIIRANHNYGSQLKSSLILFDSQVTATKTEWNRFLKNETILRNRKPIPAVESRFLGITVTKTGERFRPNPYDPGNPIPLDSNNQPIHPQQPAKAKAEQEKDQRTGLKPKPVTNIESLLHPQPQRHRENFKVVQPMPTKSKTTKPSIKDNEFTVLCELKVADTICKIQTEIAAATSLSIQTIKKILPDLENKGYIHRPEGIRKGYQITEEGKAIVSEKL